MAREKFPLTNSLIEGFLYLDLNQPKTFSEICSSVLERYGEETCLPNEKTNEGVPRYCHKIKKILSMGVKNQIYVFDESSEKYKIV
jgi:hypothetical protein